MSVGKRSCRVVTHDIRQFVAGFKGSWHRAMFVQKFHLKIPCIELGTSCTFTATAVASRIDDDGCSLQIRPGALIFGVNRMNDLQNKRLFDIVMEDNSTIKLCDDLTSADLIRVPPVLHVVPHTVDQQKFCTSLAYFFHCWETEPRPCGRAELVLSVAVVDRTCLRMMLTLRNTTQQLSLRRMIGIRDPSKSAYFKEVLEVITYITTTE